jgi:hypothetical protein
MVISVGWTSPGWWVAIVMESTSIAVQVWIGRLACRLVDMSTIEPAIALESSSWARQVRVDGLVCQMAENSTTSDLPRLWSPIDLLGVSRTYPTNFWKRSMDFLLC